MLINNLIIERILNKFSLKTFCISHDIDSLPSADVWMCGESFFYYSNERIKKSLDTFINSPVPYILVLTDLFTSTSPISGTFFKNVDTIDGERRMVNLMDSPYNFPLPLASISLPEFSHSESECTLCLWSKEQVIDALSRPINDYARYYAQMNIDKIIENSFPKNYIGSCIEVGAIDGIRDSNTYYFEKLGWQCMCVEPVPYHWPALRAQRSNATSYAISSKNEDNVDFNIAMLDNIPRCGVTGLEVDQSLYQTHKQLPGLSNLSIEVIKVNTRRLDWCINQYFYRDTIDFITIDVEGTELDVLKSFNVEQFNTKIFVIENNHNDPSIEQYMNQFGYYKCLRMFINDFYIKEPMPR